MQGRSQRNSFTQDVCDDHSSLFAVERILVSSFNETKCKQILFSKWKMVQYTRFEDK